MALNLAISFTAGTIRVPVFVDRENSDDVEFMEFNGGGIFFVGFDSQFQTVIHYYTSGDVGMYYPAITVGELAKMLGGDPESIDYGA